VNKFKELELAGWHSKAASYDRWAGAITVQAMDALLDQTQAGAGTHLLDVACGPGYGAGYATKRGASAIGIDFASNMVAEASLRYPQADFRVGDAESLAFPDGVFDCVICAFGLLHFAAPEQAVAEAYRVLKPGGRYAFTVWAGADRHAYFALLLSAIQTHGNLANDLPLGPSRFRFCDELECRRTLTSVGFIKLAITKLQLVWRARQPQDFLDLAYKCTVRTAMLLEHQEAAARDRIHQAILDGATQFKGNDGYECIWPAILVSAQKPLT
jgi:SAM-dependent methyltransferase